MSRVFLAESDHFPQDLESSSPKRRKKRTSGPAQSQTFLYHIEDEIIASIAEEGCWMEYAYDHAPKRGLMGDGEDFGVEIKGRIALVDRGKLKHLVQQVEEILD